jgi:ATP-dependent RNA helicase RhlE
MAPEIERITNMFLSNPEKIEVARAATTSENITQGVVMFKASRRDREGSEKRSVLRALIEKEGDACKNAIIFCNRKVDVDIVAKSMKKYGLNAAPIHGDLDQAHRMRTLDGFKDGSVQFLVAADVAARGLDIPDVTHVFNYDVPSHAEDYVHRIGRTGRAGRKGTAMMICVPRDEKNFADIESLVKMEIPRMENPKPAKPARAAKSEPVEDKKELKPQRSKRDEPRESGDQRRNRGRGGRKQGGYRGAPIVGMGDDAPSFILLSFDERRAANAAKQPEPVEEKPEVTEAVTEEVSVSEQRVENSVVEEVVSETPVQDAEISEEAPAETPVEETTPEPAEAEASPAPPADDDTSAA